MPYPSKEELEADCKLEGRISIFYQKPGSKDISQALAAEIGGVEIARPIPPKRLRKIRPSGLSIVQGGASWKAFLECSRKKQLETATWWQGCPTKRPERRPKGRLKKSEAFGKTSNSQL